MASGAFVSVSAAQVGTHFLREYYPVLQQQPDLCHQFYSNLSTAIHIDGDNSHTASGMMEIHTLLTSLKFTGIEIKTANWLDSWSGGVLVMVSGLVRIEQSSQRRKFFQTFFIAPQEKGYFVLNDIFHLQEEEQAPETLLADDNFETTIVSSAPITEADASESVREREGDESDSTVPDHSEESESFNKYTPPERQNVLDGNIVEEEIHHVEAEHLTTDTANVVDEPPLTAQEPIHEPPKRTYASILRAGKGYHGVPMAGHPTVARRQPPQEVSSFVEVEAIFDDEGMGKGGGRGSGYLAETPRGRSSGVRGRGNSHSSGQRFWAQDR